MNCKGCGEMIRFVHMKSGGAMPVNIKPVKFIQVDDRGMGRMAEGYISHFATCPNADDFRKKKKGE